MKGTWFAQKLIFLKNRMIFKSYINTLKKKTLAQVFSCEFYEISKNTFSYRTPSVVVSHFFEFYKGTVFPNKFQLKKTQFECH